MQCGIPCKRLKLQLSSAVCFYALSVYLALQAKIPTNPRLPHPAARRRTCAARTGSSERRKVSPRNRALCARFRKKRCPPPHPSAFLSGSTGFLFALKRKRVECQQYVNNCGVLTRTPSKNPHPHRTKIPAKLRIPRPALRRRTCAARTGSSDRRKVSPRNRALARGSGRSDAYHRTPQRFFPAPPAFFSR